MKKKGVEAQLDSFNEFESQPIPRPRLKGLKSFSEMTAGEYTIGAGFVIHSLLAAFGMTLHDRLMSGVGNIGV